LQTFLIGLHRAIEAEELRILVEGLGIDAVPLGVAVASDALGLASSVGFDHCNLTVGSGTDAARGSLAFSAELRCLSLPFGLHAPVDRLHIGLRQVDTFNTDVDDLDAKPARFLIDLAQNGAHQVLAAVAHHRLEARSSEYAPERGFKNG